MFASVYDNYNVCIKKSRFPLISSMSETSTFLTFIRRIEIGHPVHINIKAIILNVTCENPFITIIRPLTIIINTFSG